MRLRRVRLGVRRLHKHTATHTQTFVCMNMWLAYFCNNTDEHAVYTWGDSDVITMLAGFRRHLVGKTLINVFHCDIAEICFAGKLVIIQIFS